MSNVTAKVVNYIELRLDNEAANIVRSALVKMNWTDFQVASDVNEALYNAGADDETIDLVYNTETEEFDRA